MRGPFYSMNKGQKKNKNKERKGKKITLSYYDSIQNLSALVLGDSFRLSVLANAVTALQKMTSLQERIHVHEFELKFIFNRYLNSLFHIFSIQFELLNFLDVYVGYKQQFGWGEQKGSKFHCNQKDLQRLDSKSYMPDP